MPPPPFDRLLAELRRAFEANEEIRAGGADEMLRRVEARIRTGTGPGFALFESADSALRIAFPDRAPALIAELASLFWPLGVKGPVTSERAPWAAVAEPDLTPDDVPSLVVAREHAAAGTRLLLTRSISTLGRSGGDAEFQFEDASLSRVQARFRVERVSVFVEDVESTGGTYVDAARIPQGGVALKGFERIRAGNMELIYVPGAPLDAVTLAHGLITERVNAIARNWQASREQNAFGDFDDISFYKGNARWANGASADIGALEPLSFPSVAALCRECARIVKTRGHDSDYDDPASARDAFLEAIEEVRKDPAVATAPARGSSGSRLGALWRRLTGR